jgi:hypothetical protein
MSGVCSIESSPVLHTAPGSATPPKVVVNMEIQTQKSVQSLPTSMPSPSSSNFPKTLVVGLGLDLNSEEVEEEDLYPLENFTLVCRGVYRSSFPKKKNFPFMKKLGLKSVLYVIFLKCFRVHSLGSFFIGESANLK